jgi:hypothetical protein
MASFASSNRLTGEEDPDEGRGPYRADDRQKLTRKSVPEPDWMAGTIGPAEY